jgi:hypothetical protein
MIFVSFCRHIALSFLHERTPTHLNLSDHVLQGDQDLPAQQFLQQESVEEQLVFQKMRKSVSECVLDGRFVRRQELAKKELELPPIFGPQISI